MYLSKYAQNGEIFICVGFLGLTINVTFNSTEYCRFPGNKRKLLGTKQFVFKLFHSFLFVFCKHLLVYFQDIEFFSRSKLEFFHGRLHHFNLRKNDFFLYQNENGNLSNIK